jgi:hypothetical protein
MPNDPATAPSTMPNEPATAPSTATVPSADASQADSEGDITPGVLPNGEADDGGAEISAVDTGKDKGVVVDEVSFNERTPEAASTAVESNESPNPPLRRPSPPSSRRRH